MNKALTSIFNFSPRWRIMPYDVHGKKLFAVEIGNYTDGYFDTKADAEARVEELKVWMQC
jgi:hypothetical protein